MATPWWLQAEAARALGLLRVPTGAASRSSRGSTIRTRRCGQLRSTRSGGWAMPRACPPCSRALARRLAPPARPRGRGPARARAAGGGGARRPRPRPARGPRHGCRAGRLHRGASATEDLLAWCGHPDARVRASSLQAIGSLGLDDRAYYYTLRALGDDDAGVRAMAARALGRSRRGDAAAYLAQHLGDEWLVAAHAATALRMLGPSGERSCRRGRTRRACRRAGATDAVGAPASGPTGGNGVAAFITLLLVFEQVVLLFSSPSTPRT